MPEIFLIVAADFVKTGGMDRANYALADYLARGGWEVHLVAHRVGLGLLARSTVRWHRVARPLGRDALGWGRLRRAGEGWARRLKLPPSQVLVNGGNCPWPGLNWVHYVHAAYAAPVAGSLPRRGWQAFKHRRAMRDEYRALSRAHRVIANSWRTRTDLIERLGVAPDRIRVVYYGCDPEAFSAIQPEESETARAMLGWPRSGRTALFVGALGDRRKGFDVLFAAWQRLCQRPDWDVTLAVAGRGSELDAWRRRVQAAGLDRCIHFLGFRRDIPALLAASDVLVAPVRYEAYGLGVHEALARGLPVLVSGRAGVAERIPEALGGWRLHDVESVGELEQKLLRWRMESAAPTPPWSEALARLGAQLRVETWDAMAARIVALASGDENAGAAAAESGR